MSSVEEITQMADSMELRGEERKNFIREQWHRLCEVRERTQREEAERQAQLVREERQAQLAREEADRQAKLAREEADRQAQVAREEAERQHELEKLRIQAEIAAREKELADRNNRDKARPKMPKLPSFVDGKDEMDSWLLRFERFAESCRWKNEDWAIILSALLTGRALEAYCRLSQEEAVNYEKVKEALLTRYNLTEDGYRIKFRSCKPEEGESPSMFVVRIKTYLERWLELAKMEENYEGLRDLFVREQFMDASPEDLAIYLRERSLKTVEEMAEAANKFLVARNRHLSNRPRKSTSASSRSKLELEEDKGEPNVCLKCKKPGHRAVDCKTGSQGKPMCFRCRRPGHVMKNCPLKERTAATTARKAAGAVRIAADEELIRPSRKDGVLLDTTEDVKAEIQNGMLQLASGNKVSVLTNCGACRDREPAEDLRLPILKGLVGDKTVDVLRDTGCEGVVVRRGLVEDSQLTGKSCLLRRIDNTTLLADKAVIAIKTPYLSGQVEALCIPEAICDLVVGNVEGARNPDDPDKSVMVGAMTTRAQERKEAKSRPLQVPKEEGHGGVDRTPLIQPQREDPAIQTMVQVKTPEMEGRSTFERTMRSRSGSRPGRSQSREGPRRLCLREGKRSRSRELERRENRKEATARERSKCRSRSGSRSSSYDEVTRESCKSRTPGEKEVSPPAAETEVEDEPIDKVEKPVNFGLMTQERTYEDDENGGDEGGGKKKQDDEIDPPDAYRHSVHDDEKILKEEDKRVVTENDRQAKIVLYVVTTVKKKEEDRGKEKGELMLGNVNALECSSGKEKKDLNSTMAHWYKLKKDFGAEGHGEVYLFVVPEIVQMTNEEVDQFRDEKEDVSDRGKHSLKPTKSWAQCKVRKKVMEMMRKYNYEDLTPIQHQAVPAFKFGRDVIGIVGISGGGALAFVMPMIRHTVNQLSDEKGDDSVAVVVIPICRLALRSAAECKQPTKPHGLRAVCVHGGTSVSEQIAELREGCEIIVCTPGS